MLQIYTDFEATRLLKNQQLFIHTDGGVDFTVFNLTNFLGTELIGLYKVTGSTAVKLTEADYTVVGNSITLLSALLPAEKLIAIPTDHLVMDIAGGLNKQISLEQKIFLKRDSVNSYTSIAILSKDRSVAQLDFSANAVFSAGVGQGFTGLIPNSLVGCAVFNLLSFRGFITSNTETTITLNTAYTQGASLPTDIVSVSDLEFAEDTNGLPGVYSKVLNLGSMTSDAVKTIWLKHTVQVSSYKDIPHNTIVLLGMEA